MAEKYWWETEPWRMVQTNLREIDMEDMDAEAFAQELSDFHATVVNLNAAGLIASYDTKLPFQKKSGFLHGDSLKQVLDACHRRGIRVIARCDFSKIAWELYEAHPDWVYRDAEGKIRSYEGYVQTCLNGPYQQEHLFEILKELFTTHNFDGIFCNMTSVITMGYDYELLAPCHCDNCRRLFEEETGMQVPDRIDPKDPAFMRFMAFQGKRSQMQKMKMTKMLKAIRPAIAVNGVDFKRSETNQDVGRATQVYDASSNARRVRGLDGNTVSDNASVDFLGFRYRHSSVSSPVMELRQWQNLAHTGSLSLYIMGPLGKHCDRSGIRASRKVFDFMAAHEEIYTGMKSAARVLLVDRQQMGREDPETAGIIRALTQLQIPFDEAALSALNADALTRYDTVILPDVRNISDMQAALFDEYTEQGGTLIATGHTAAFTERGQKRDTIAVRAFGLGSTGEIRSGMKSSILEIRDEDEAVLSSCASLGLGYVVPGDEILVPEYQEGTETFLRLVPEQPAGPPEVCYAKEKTDIPGAYRNRFGKGTAVYIPFAAGSFYRTEGYENTFAFLKDVFFGLAGIKSPAVNLNPMTELVVTEKPGMTALQLINTSGCFDNSFFEPLPMYGVRLKWDVRGKKVYTLNGGKIETSPDGQEISLNRLDHYEAVIIED